MERSAAFSMIREHFAAAGTDEERVSADYVEDAILDFPQGGERIRGRGRIRAFRSAYPARVRLTPRRIVGSGDIWVIESTIAYDEIPHFSVAIWELRDGKVAHETVYVSDGWEPPASRAEWVEPMPEADVLLEQAR
jgi:SnoaL-like protein